jgi:hypothetical protein
MNRQPRWSDICVSATSGGRAACRICHVVDAPERDSSAAFTGADGIVQILADHVATVDVQDRHGEMPWSMAAGLSPVRRYRGQHGAHESTATPLQKLGARPVTQEELDARAAASSR